MTTISGELLDDKGAVINVRHPDYGAKGDGTTDDTSAIQDALDAASGNLVVIPSGLYKITSGLSLNGGQHLLVIGELITDGDFSGVFLKATNAALGTLKPTGSGSATSRSQLGGASASASRIPQEKCETSKPVGRVFSPIRVNPVHSCMGSHAGRRGAQPVAGVVWLIW